MNDSIAPYMTFTIVGQGLAGTWVALGLQRAGHHVRIIDPQNAQTSSRVAAGIVNPITGQRLKPTWRGDTLLPHARNAFKLFEASIASSDDLQDSTPIWRDIELRHAFRNASTMEWFEKRVASNELANMRLSRIDVGEFEGVAYPHGGCVVHDAAIVDVAGFLDKGRAALLRNGAEFTTATASADNVDAYSWQHAQPSDFTVWCIGIDALKHPLWSWLTLEPSKGEMLEVRMCRKLPYILNSGTWIAPLMNSNYLVGATNDWDDHELTLTDAARVFLLDEIKRITGKEAEIVDHRVAIRPSTLRKRPLIGVHPVNSRHAVLTGLGSKGCQLAPWAAEQLVDHLLNGTPLEREVDIIQDFPV